MPLRRFAGVTAAGSLLLAASTARAADPEAISPGTTPPPSSPSYPTKTLAPPAPPIEGFSFGSYGRVTAASDLRGGSGRSANVVAFGTRLDLPTYAEIQLERRDRYETRVGPVTTNVVFTLAFAGPLFHESGVFEATSAIRNLYAEAKGFTVASPFHLSAWIGSRMYRGDDVYLLNWWPLDNLNIVGGGVRLAIDTTSREATSVALAVGLGRAQDPFSFQTRPSPSPSGFGATEVIVLDRPRTIGSLKAQHVEFFGPKTDDEGQPLEGPRPGFKVALYGEQHGMPRGTRIDESDVRRELPAENGSMIGGQLGLFTGERDVFVNVWVRYATGLAAYPDKTVPSALSIDRTTAGAREALVALSANYEKGPFGLMAGAYLRGFRDASGNQFSRNTFNEGTLALRPMAWFAEVFGLALEGSYQASTTAGVRDDGTADRASMWRFGVVPFLTPGGRGSFMRPHFQLIYLYSRRDEGTRLRYAIDDKFRTRTDEHFFGLGVEWWFNSSYR
jgi:maltoporin